MTITAEQVEQAINKIDHSDTPLCDIDDALALFRQYVAQQPKWEKCECPRSAEEYALRGYCCVDGQWYSCNLPPRPAGTRYDLTGVSK